MLPLPVYELGLMASERAWDAQVALRVTVFTPESAPLAAFGTRVSGQVASLLAERALRRGIVPNADCGGLRMTPPGAGASLKT